MTGKTRVLKESNAQMLNLSRIMQMIIMDQKIFISILQSSESSKQAVNKILKAKSNNE